MTIGLAARDKTSTLFYLHVVLQVFLVSKLRVLLSKECTGGFDFVCMPI